MTPKLTNMLMGIELSKMNDYNHIIENIRYGNLKTTEEEIYAVAKLANAHEFIIMQENGYQTVLKNREQSLSGGERQRIAVARAILKDAPIILFDEATSALDNETELMIQKVVDKLKCKKTIIAIVHNP